MDIHVYNNNKIRQPCDSNKSVQILFVSSDIYLCRLRLKQGREIGFYVLRQGIPEGRSSEGYASFKQIKSWPWRVEVIPGISVRCREFSVFFKCTSPQLPHTTDA